MSDHLISRRTSCLLIVDLQERLAPSVDRADALVRRIGLLLRAARRLEVPVLATEHYARGLGTTVPEVRGALADDEILEKIHFNAAAEPEALDRIRALDRPQVIITGAEAHVCVLQTTLGLLAQGFRPLLVADAISSREPANREAAVMRARDAGVPVVTSEMVVFEWLERGATEAFRDLLPLIRDAGPTAVPAPIETRRAER